jgi:outer membrane murein-binding lipoprotein Lpp
MSTEAIDNLQEQPDPKDNPKFGKFFANFAVKTAGTIGFVVLGSIGLYITKVAMAGILPTNYDPSDLNKSDMPYGCHPKGSQPKKDINPIEMNIVKEYGMKGLAVLLGYNPINSYCQEATFDQQAFDKSFNNGYIKGLAINADSTRPPSDYKGPPGSWRPSNLAIWVSKVTNSSVSNSFKIIETIYSWFSKWPEWLVLLLMGSVGLMIIPILMMCNIFMSVYYHLTCLPGLLTKGMTTLNTQTREESDPGRPDAFWQSEINGRWYNNEWLFTTSVDDYKNGIPWTASFQSGFLWLIITLALIPYFIIRMLFISPIVTTFYTLIKTIFDTKYKLKKAFNFSGNDDDSNNYTGSKGFGSFIKDTFVYKRTYLICLSIINLLIQTSTFLGTNYLVGVFVAIIMAIWFCDILVSTKPDDDNTLIQQSVDNDNDNDDNSDKDLDEDVDNDECDDINDITDIWRQKVEESWSKIQDNQTKATQLLFVIKDCINKRNDKTTFPTLKDITLPGFSELQMSVDELIKAYFNCDAMNKNTILLKKDAKYPITIQSKLKTQVKQMDDYNTQLEHLTKECKLVFFNFVKTNTTFSDIKNINANSKKDINSILGIPNPDAFLTLMSSVSNADGNVYTTRPTLIDFELTKLYYVPSDSDSDTSSVSSTSSTSTKSSVSSTSTTGTSTGMAGKTSTSTSTSTGMAGKTSTSTSTGMAGGTIVRPSVGKGEQLGNKMSNIQVGLKLKSKASLIQGDTKLTTAVFTLEEAIKDVNRTLLKTGSSADNDMFNDWLINGTVDMATNNMISVWIDKLNSLDDIVDNEKDAQDTAIEAEQDKKDKAKAEADKKAKAGPIGAGPPPPGTPVITPGATSGSTGSTVTPPGTPVTPSGATSGSTGSTVTPPGSTVTPSGTTSGLTGATVTPPGAPVIPPGTPVIPPGTPVIPSGAPVIPPGAPVIPSGTPVIPSGATVTPTITGGSNTPKTKGKINIRLV